MSYNFNPQPSSQPLPFSTASMQVPIKPQITFPIPKDFYYATSYHSGAVRMATGDNLIGDCAQAPGDFTCFVASFWATNLIIKTFAHANVNYYFRGFGPVGTVNLGGGPGFLSSGFIIQLDYYGELLVTWLDTTNTATFGTVLGAGSGSMGLNHFFGISGGSQFVTPGVWHHFIVSVDTTTGRCQTACDRGGGPDYGGGVMDTALGFDLTFPRHDIGTQKAVSGFTFPGAGPFHNNTNTDWQIQSSTLTDGTAVEGIDLAYMYCGKSTTFFNLTTPGNLDFFVTPELTPVDFGREGSNVPLTCLFMHTGNLEDPFIGGKLQFPYNAANGRLWGGVLADAPSEPPVGA